MASLGHSTPVLCSMLGRYFVPQLEKFLQSSDILQKQADFEAKMSPPEFAYQSAGAASVRVAWLVHCLALSKGH